MLLLTLTGPTQKAASGQWIEATAIPERRSFSGRISRWYFWTMNERPSSMLCFRTSSAAGVKRKSVEV